MRIRKKLELLERENERLYNHVNHLKEQVAALRVEVNDYRRWALNNNRVTKPQYEAWTEAEIPQPQTEEQIKDREKKIQEAKEFREAFSNVYGDILPEVQFQTLESETK